MADTFLDVEARLKDFVSGKFKEMEGVIGGSSKKISESADGINGRFDKMAGFIKKAGVALVGFAGIKVLKNQITDVAKLGDNYDKLSQRLGVSTTFLQELNHVAGLGGSSAQEMSAGIRRLAKNVNDANNGLSTAVRSFKQAGVEIRNVDGSLKSVEQIFQDTVSGLANVEGETQKVALAQELLGRSGTALLPIVNLGSDAYAKQAEEAHRLGVVMNDEQIQATVDYTDAVHRMNQAITGIKIKVLIPVVRELADAIQGFVDSGGFDVLSKGLRNVSDTARLAKAVLGDFTSQVAVLWLQIKGDRAGAARLIAALKEEQSETSQVIELMNSRNDIMDKRLAAAEARLAKARAKKNKKGGGPSVIGEAEAAAIEKEREESVKRLAAANSVQEELYLITLSGQEKELVQLDIFEAKKREILEAAGQDTVLLDEAVEAKRDAINQKYKEKKLKAEKDLANKKAKIEEREKKRRDKAEAQRAAAQQDSIVALISSFGALTGAMGANAQIQKGIASTEAIIQGALAVQKALAAGVPPWSYIQAAAVGIKTTANIATIKAQKFGDGGMINRPTLAMMGEAGTPEAVLNPRATANIGVGGVNALNSGQQINRQVTNEINYSPNITIESGTGAEAFAEILFEDKERFAKLFRETQERGYLDA